MFFFQTQKYSLHTSLNVKDCKNKLESITTETINLIDRENGLFKGNKLFFTGEIYDYTFKLRRSYIFDYPFHFPLIEGIFSEEENSKTKLELKIGLEPFWSILHSLSVIIVTFLISISFFSSLISFYSLIFCSIVFLIYIFVYSIFINKEVKKAKNKLIEIFGAQEF